LLKRTRRFIHGDHHMSASVLPAEDALL